jgi:uncharacterized protein
VTAASAPDRRLIVFARLPRRGRVKTRLAATVGEDLALRAYRSLLDRTLALAASVPVQCRELLIAEGDPRPVETAWLDTLRDAGWRVGRQATGGLGERMAGALSAALAQRQLPVLIGCDCPVLEASDVAAAFEALGSSDAVFSPTEDGGYALVGIARALPEAFRSVPWGSATVMAVTRDRLRACGARWFELRTLWDVDVEADLRRWQGDTRG